MRSRSAPVDNPNIALDANECMRGSAPRASRSLSACATSGAAGDDRLDKLGCAGISERRKQRTGSKYPFAALKLDQRNSVRVSSGVRRATSRNGGGFVAEARRVETGAYRRSKAGDTVAVLTVESPTAPWPILERQFPNRARVQPVGSMHLIERRLRSINSSA